MSDTPEMAGPSEQERALLRRRASVLARPLVDRALGQEGELLVARLGAARYAVRLRELAAVTRLSRIARIPQAPNWVAGLAHEHGDVFTVVDLGALTGEKSSGPLRFGLLVEVGGEPFALGVPELEGMERDWSGGLDPLPPGVPEKARHFIETISPTGTCRLNLSRLLVELARITTSPGSTR